ncbi:MAG: tetratricopeptide repeat protein [Candidatus Gastranaerophilales bacterium]|nr:tetratricopeptide repeat protein [Candidatus Gastranaerophilales bacterium]
MFEETANYTFETDKDFDFDSMAQSCLEDARKFHEQYLIKGQKNDLNNAVDNYIDAIKFNPNIAEAYYRLAALLWDKGEINLNSAIEQCKSAINLSPSNPNARIYAGFFLELAKNYDDAEKEFKAAIKLSPFKSARSRFSLASLYLDKMQNTKINPKDFSQYLYYMLSGSLTVSLDYPSLKMIYKNLSKNISLAFYNFAGGFLEKTKNYTMAVKAYDIAADATGRSEIFYNKIGDINIKEEEISEARNSYIKALEANPYNKELLLKVATISQVYFENDVDIPIDCYSKLLEIEENNAGIYYELGHLYLKKDDYINSINAFKLALEKDNSNPFYHNALAYSLVRAEQYDEACEHYKFAIEKNPDPEWTAIVCQALASLYYNVFDDTDSAMDLLQFAIMLDSSNDEVFLELGDIYSDSEDLDSAIKSYCEAVKLNPKNPIAYNKCAMALWQKDYLEEAIIAYNKAINIDSGYYAAYNNLGVIYLDGIRNLKEAEKLFKKAISLKEDYVMAHFNLGRTYAVLEKNIDAAKEFQIALDFNEKNQELDSESIKTKLYELFEV